MKSFHFSALFSILPGTFRTQILWKLFQRKGGGSRPTTAAGPAIDDSTRAGLQSSLDAALQKLTKKRISPKK